MLELGPRRLDAREGEEERRRQNDQVRCRLLIVHGFEQALTKRVLRDDVQHVGRRFDELEERSDG